MKIQAGLVWVMIATILMGCAGRAANPVMIQQYGDDTKTCQALEREMAFIQGEIQRLIPQTEKTGKNVALGVTGFFFLVPLFFMDLSKAEQIEVDAYRQRYNHLLIIAAINNAELRANRSQNSENQVRPMLTRTKQSPKFTVKPTMRTIMKKLILLSFVLLPLQAMADCRCVCMEGEVRAVCSSTLDIEPICPPRICPITPPSVQPIQQPRVPPIGTKTCTQKQVHNEYTRRYEWKEVCY